MDDIRQSLRPAPLLDKDEDYSRFLSLIPKKLWTDRDNWQIDFEDLRACYQAFKAIHDALEIPPLPNHWRDYLDKVGHKISPTFGKGHLACSNVELFEVFTRFDALRQRFDVGKPQEYRDHRGLTPLAMAIEVQNQGFCKFFLGFFPNTALDLQIAPAAPLALRDREHGGPVHAPYAGMTAGTFAVNKKAPQSIIQLFKDNPVLTQRDAHGDTPLRAAIRAGSLDHVRWLCDADPNMNAAQIRDFDGYLPLAVAVRCGQAETVEELLKRNKKLADNDRDQDTDAFVVLWRYWPKLDPDARADISFYLRRASPDCSFLDKMHQFTVEHALKRDYSLAEHLLEVEDAEGIDFSFAVDSKDPRLMKMLLKTVAPDPDELRELVQRAEKIGATEIVALLKAIPPEDEQ